MDSLRIHVMGASGAGTTTLGRALADRLAIPHHDTDDYYWSPTLPPYRKERPAEDRLRLMHEMFVDRSGWVLSGSVQSWGDSIIPYFDLVAFLTAPTSIRLARLRDREVRRFGAEAIAPGGWHHEETESFIEWASHYDDGTREGRNRVRHQAWLDKLSCPVLRMNGRRPIPDLVNDVLRELAKVKQSGTD